MGADVDDADHDLSLQAAQFCRGAGFVSAQQTTVSSGIADLLPGSDIDEFVFEPCGYSMNGLQVASPCHQSICCMSCSVA